MFQKFAKLEVLEVKSAPSRERTASLSKFADYNDYRTDDGYVYVRVRAISSRVNKNHDGWPSSELEKSWRTFIGKPIFVDHHNSDPKRARGVIVDAALHIEDEKTSSLDPYYSAAPANHLPATWIELLLEVDAKKFPKLAKAVVDGDIDGVSMGANVEMSKCSHCGNEATTPEQFCKHVQSKGAYFDYHLPNGQKIAKKSYEDCYGVGFFEISFVFDPADETALVSDIKKAARVAAVQREGALDFETCPSCGEAYGVNEAKCPNCWTPNPKTQQNIQALPRQERGLMIDPNVPAQTPSPQWLAKTAAQRYGIGEEVTIAYGPGSGQQGKVSDFNLNGGVISYTIDTPHGAVQADQEDLVPVHEINSLPTQAQAPNPMWLAKTAGMNDEVRKLKSQGLSNEAIARGVGCSVQEVEQILQQRRADRNPEPQSEMTVAPDQVDTLRQEQVCPICGSDMEDGVCEVCNYEEPPEGFDNPDLAKAKEVDEQMHQQDAQQAAEGQAPGAPNDIQTNPNDPSSPQPMPGGAMPATSKVAESGTVTSEHKTSAQGGRINTQERPILPVTRQLSDKPIDKKVVSDSKAPVESKTRKDNMTDQIKTADGASPNGEGVQADKRVDVEGVGAVTGDPLSGITNENVEKDTGDFTAPHTDTWSGGEGDSLGQQDAVTSDTGDFATVSSTEKTADGAQTWDAPGHGFPDHDPTRVELDGSLKEEVGGPTSTDSSEEFRSLKAVNPVDGGNANEVGGPIGVAIASAKAQVYKALKVAETEVELGIIDNDAKFDRASELEDTPVEALDAQIEAYAKVKTAGLRKAPAQKTASAGRVPSFRPVASFDIEAHAVQDEFEDSIF